MDWNLSLPINLVKVGPMTYRFAAIFLLILGLVLGISLILSTGANTLTKQALGLAAPTLTGLFLAQAWWRQARDDW